MENDQNPLLVHTSPSTMENDQSQLASDKGPSSLKSERYGHEGSSTGFFGLSPLKSVRPEKEGLSSFFEGLPDLDTKRPYKRTSFFEDLNTFEHDEPFPKKEEKKETKESREWKRLYEQSQKLMLDEEVVKQISKHVINLPGAGFDPNGENNGGE